MWINEGRVLSFAAIFCFYVPLPGRQQLNRRRCRRSAARLASQPSSRMFIALKAAARRDPRAVGSSLMVRGAAKRAIDTSEGYFALKETTAAQGLLQSGCACAQDRRRKLYKTRGLSVKRDALKLTD
jgi:hypothetical protein